MPLHYLRNPMYALCLLAAFCVRQHMQNNRYEIMTSVLYIYKYLLIIFNIIKIIVPFLSLCTNRIEQPLTKRISIQTPILINAKPNEPDTKIISHSKNFINDFNNNFKIEESDLLINCLQIIAKRTRQILESIQASIPVNIIIIIIIDIYINIWK